MSTMRMRDSNSAMRLRAMMRTTCHVCRDVRTLGRQAMCLLLFIKPESGVDRQAYTARKVPCSQQDSLCMGVDGDTSQRSCYSPPCHSKVMEVAVGGHASTRQE